MKDLVKRMSRMLATVCVLFVMTTFCASAFAQSGAGSIQGTVTDPTGAVIPGALIHVVNQGTGVAIDTKSNNVWLLPGSGSVHGELCGDDQRTWHEDI